VNRRPEWLACDLRESDPVLVPQVRLAHAEAAVMVLRKEVKVLTKGLEASRAMAASKGKEDAYFHQVCSARPVLQFSPSSVPRVTVLTLLGTPCYSSRPPRYPV
jgi:hypothetical protein